MKYEPTRSRIFTFLFDLYIIIKANILPSLPRRQKYLYLCLYFMNKAIIIVRAKHNNLVMMRGNVFLWVLLLIGTINTCLAQSKSTNVCRLGLTYDISQSKHWGNGKPVIKSVTPYSSAEQAGVRQYDVIEEISGVPVTEVSAEEIAQLMNPSGENEVTLKVSNLSNPSRLITIKKDCKKSNAITEDQLASAFAMYSLETTYEQEFICPFKTTVTSDPVDFSDFKTFSFSTIDENNQELETFINECIENELTKKGLTIDIARPDILIQTYYFFDKNPNYVGSNKVVVEKTPTYRYNFTINKMEKLPFLSISAVEAEAQYLLQFGIRLIDQKEMPGRVLWECEANELLESSYQLKEYAKIHVPLMCMQYPYVKYRRNIPFKVSTKSYNYTGIHYDIDDLEKVIEVDRNSPAYAAGIRPLDIIERIGKQKMNYSAEEFSRAYKRFITHTLSYRDTKTLFTDANGFNYCMQWNMENYPQVAETLQDPEYKSAFSYLYYFTPYINPSGNNACTFSIKRNKTKMDVIIRPTIRSEVTVEIE